MSLKKFEIPERGHRKGSERRVARGDVDAAQRLLLDRGFGAVSIDDLASAAGVARRTLYNPFARKEEIFREMLLRVSGQLARVPIILTSRADSVLTWLASCVVASLVAEARPRSAGAAIRWVRLLPWRNTSRS